MGTTFVDLTISSLKDPSKTVMDEFLVDSGATHTVLPENLWKKLEIEPIGTVRVQTADGRLDSRQTGFALVTFKEITIPTRVILGQVDDSQLLGVVTLEEMGLLFDPLKRTLKSADIRL